MKKLVFLLIPFIVACNPCKRLAKRCDMPGLSDTTIVSDTTIETDYSTWTEPDSSWIYFALECDSAYNVILKEYNELNSGIESKVEVREVFREDKTKIQRLEFNITALVDSLEIQNKTIQKLRSEKRVIQVPYPVEQTYYRSRPFWIYTGLGFFALILLGIVILWMKFKTKFFS